MKDYIQGLLQEGSTTRGLIWVLGAFGVYNLSAEQTQAVTALVMALAGAHGIAVRDRLSK